MNQKRNRKHEKGFTLIELMIVIAIIGILAAIAIPNFISYRMRAFDADAQSAIKNLMTAEEAYFADNAIYTDTISTLPGFTQSSQIEIVVSLTSTTGYAVSARHTSSENTWSIRMPNGTMSKL
jgi:type IV pilus assembly protein PilA